MRMPPIAVGAVAGLALIALLIPATGEALGELSVARTRAAEVARDAARPATFALVAPSLAITAPSQPQASAALAARVRVLAGRGGVLVEGLDTGSGDVALAMVRVRLSGSEGAVIALADALERGTPLARFTAWRVEPTGDGVRLTGELVAPWR